VATAAPVAKPIAVQVPVEPFILAAPDQADAPAPAAVAPSPAAAPAKAVDKTAAVSPAAAKTSSTPSDTVKAAAPKVAVATKPVAAETVVANPTVGKTAMAKTVRAETVPAETVPAKPVLAEPVPAKPVVANPAVVEAAAAVTVATPAVSARVAAAPADRLPKAVQEMAETGIGQARDAYVRIKTAAETLASGLETSGSATSKGVHAYSVAVIEAMQVHLDAGFGLMRSLAGVRTVSEAIELQTSHARRQFEAVNAQAKTLASIANRTATEAAAPVRDALGRLR
jgi:hypothetical protein